MMIKVIPDCTIHELNKAIRMSDIKATILKGQTWATGNVKLYAKDTDKLSQISKIGR